MNKLSITLFARCIALMLNLCLTQAAYAAPAKKSVKKSITRVDKLEAPRKQLKKLKAEYVQSQKSYHYERTIRNLRKKFEAQEKFQKELNAHEKFLVQRELRVGKNPASKATARYNAIGVVTRFVATIDEVEKREPYLKDIALMYSLAGNHKKAVSMYLSLAENSEASGKKQLYLGLAARSQTQVAGWPTNLPWNNYRIAARKQEHIKLHRIYSQWADTYENKINWRIHAHMGLLDLALGNEAQAFDLWRKDMEASPLTPEAARAAGIMLAKLEGRKDWHALEDMSKMCLRLTIRAVYQDKPYNVNNALALSLIWGGRQDLDNNDYAAASQRLKEFVTTFRSHPLHEDGLYFLAFAYRGEGKHSESLATINELLKTHPQSRYSEQALLHAGEWARSMALEDALISYYENYLQRFAAGKDAPQVRKDLWEMYLGRGFYGQASDLMRAHLHAKGVSSDEAIATAFLWLDTEEKHGSLQRAQDVANMLLTWRFVTPELKANALVVKARFAHSKNDMASLTALEGQIAQLSGGENATEALSEVRYYSAALISAKIGSEEIFNLELRDPLATLNQEYARFVDAKTRFEKVCVSGNGSFCLPAMYEVSRTADRLLNRIQNVDIPASLSAKEVTTFNKRKTAIVDTLARSVEVYMDKSLALIGEGNSFPETVKQVLWESSVDWTFDSVVGESGSAHLGFNPKYLVEDKEQ